MKKQKEVKNLQDIITFSEKIENIEHRQYFLYGVACQILFRSKSPLEYNTFLLCKVLPEHEWEFSTFVSLKEIFIPYLIANIQKIKIDNIDNIDTLVLSAAKLFGAKLKFNTYVENMYFCNGLFLSEKLNFPPISNDKQITKIFDKKLFNDINEIYTTYNDKLLFTYGLFLRLYFDTPQKNSKNYRHFFYDESLKFRLDYILEIFDALKESKIENLNNVLCFFSENFIRFSNNLEIENNTKKILSGFLSAAAYCD